jgi:sulfate permease, SulP family
MKKLDFKSLKGDFFGGITAGVVGLPLCLAFGATSGLGPVAGLYGGIVLGVLAAFFGGTPTLISAPTGPMTVVSALIIAAQIKIFGSVEAAMGAIVFTFVVAGLFQIALGSLKLGKYIDFLPYPVISGFMSGIGVIVISMQIPDFFGAPSHGKSALANIVHLPDYFHEFDFHAVIIALITLVVARIFPLITKAIPATLVALIAGTASYLLLGFHLKTIGTIPTQIPNLKFAEMFGLNLNQISHLIVPALSLGALGMIDTLMTAVVADKMTRTKHKSNKELIGQGIGNIGAAMFGGLPGAGTTVVTVTNINGGSSSRLSGIFQGLFLALVLFVGAQYAGQIPNAVLAGLLVSIGINIIDYTFFKDIKFIPKSDMFIILLVFVLTVTWDLMYATAIGFVIASVFFMKKMSDTIDEYSQGSKIDLISKKLISQFDNAEEFKNDVYIKQLNGPLFFGFAARIEQSIKQLPDIKKLIFDMRNVPYIDQTGLYSFRDAIDDLALQNISVYLIEPNESITLMMKDAHIIGERVPLTNVFENQEACILWIHDIEDPKHHDADLDIHIPSAFSPNEDGENDIWDIGGLDKYRNCIVNIFTYEGIQVFESIGYTNAWDGTCFGKPLPAGKYNFKITLPDSNNLVLKGKVSLIR